MSNHAKKEPSAKNSSSLANLRSVIASQPETAPRKAVSHEGLSKASQDASNPDSTSGPANVGVSSKGFVDTALTNGNSSGSGNSSSNSSSAGGVSTFSYLKARLFGSVADASTSLTSSARDLLQSKKSSEQSKGSPIEPSFGGNPSTAPHRGHDANRSASTITNPTTNHHNDHAQIILTGPTSTSSLSTPSKTSTASTSMAASDLSYDPQRSPTTPNSQRFFSRTLPNRRQPQPEPLQFTQGKQARPVSPTSPSLPSVSKGLSLLSPASTHSPPASSPSTDQKQRPHSAVSNLNAQKHLSTGSLIYQEGYLNKKVELHSGETGHGWKVYKVVLKSSKVYFFKPVLGDERPQFQEPKDHHRHYLSPNHANRGEQGYHHQQHSSSSVVISPRLSITNECGMVLSAFNFESSTRTLLFEGNAKSLGQSTQAFAPPITKYVYGECFTEIDRLTMQFKKHVALLLFEDSVVICKRKWMRNTSQKVKDAIKFSSNSHEKVEPQETASGKRQGSTSGISHKSGDSRGSDGDQRSRSSFDYPSEKQRGYFTKWKHEATYPLSQVEALDMASPVPSASATFYPFASPATASAGGLSYTGRTSRDLDVSSIYTTASSMPSHTHQTTSTLELVITSLIDGKEYTHRLLYLPPSQEVRHQWYSKFNRAKELHQSHSRVTSKGRGSAESLVLKDTLSPRSAHSNHSTISLHSPTSPTASSEAGNFVLSNRKMDRARAFCDTTTHPDLALHKGEVTGTQRLQGASINGFIHEVVYSNVTNSHELVLVFATTFPLFTTVSHTLKELRRCIGLQSSIAPSGSPVGVVHRVEALIQEMVKGFHARSTDAKALEETRAFTEEILKDKLGSLVATDILEQINVMLHDHDVVTGEPFGQGHVHPTRPSESSVDLSNVLITGLTPALFLKLEASYFAEQVLRYHASQLHMVGDLSTLLKNPAFFMRRYPTAGTSQALQSSLVFSMYSPHFLTVLITHHILIATQSVQSTSRRPKLLAQWIRTARSCRALGDMAGFMAIAIGVCSPGVVRLQETWKQVPLDLRLEVARTWVPLLIKMDMITEDLQELAISSFDLKSSLNAVIDTSLDGPSTIVPCVSNIKQSIDQLDRVMPSFLQSSPVPLLNIEKLEHIYSILTKATHSRPENFPSAMAGTPSPENGHLQQYFGHLASISQTLHDQYHSNDLSNDAFESSLACEPHFNGQYLDYHYKNRKMTGSFIPLMFPEVIRERRLFPQPLLLTLENTGNTYRKSSFDDDQSSQPSSSTSKPPTPVAGPSLSHTQGSVDWADSSATHHGTTNLGAAGVSAYPRSRKRTYSFPPARASSRSGGASSCHPLINMINPHLDAVASGCLQSSDESDSNEVVAAMRDVAGIGYCAISLEGGNLMVKAKEENLETLMKAALLEEEEDLAAQLQTPRTNWNTGNTAASKRSSLSLLSGSRLAMVKAGTLEALIHVAVMGLEDQNGKYVDEKGDLISWTSRQLSLNHGSFVKAFFATFRSFCTPGRLLDQLVTMFTFAQEARSRISNIPSCLDLFPGSVNSSPAASGTVTGSRDSSSLDWRRVLAMQLNVLRALEHWLLFHSSDFLDDLSLKTKLSEALKLMTTQEASQKQLMGDEHSNEAAILCGRLVEAKKLAIQQMMKPLDTVGMGADTLETFFATPPSMAPQLDDSWAADQILDQLNTAALAHYLSVREQEWFMLFEVLESQSADPLGWYLGNPSTVPAEEDIIITGIHNTLYTIRRNGAPGTHWNGERLMNSLPLCLQSLCKLHHVIRGWVILQIASPNITFDVRLGRVQKMLDILALSRRAMARFGNGGSTSSSARTADSKHSVASAGVPSFVENAIVSALISPESRAYSRVWLEVASSRRGSVETLEDVLGSLHERQALNSYAANVVESKELVPAIGWLIERMLETCCYVRDMSYESPLLVNFDKRMYVYDLVQVYARRQDELRTIPRTKTPLSSWLGLSTGPSSNMSLKLVKEAAHREAVSQRGGSTGQLSPAGNHSGKSSRPARIFSRLVVMQVDKMKRDQKEFEKLEKQIKDTQGRIQKAQQEQAKTLEKQIKLEQSRSRVKNQLLKSTLMRAMRPISLAITNSWSTATTTVSNATALGSAISGKAMGGTSLGGAADALGASAYRGEDLNQLHIQPRTTSLMGSGYSTTSPKPVLVINLINSTCSVAYTYTKRDFVFKIVTEEGGQSLLQALDYEDMLRWIRILNEAAAEATAKRRTLLDSDELLKNGAVVTVQADELPHTVQNERQGRNSVFGIELRHLMSDGNIPLIVEKCITEIERRGLEEVGIYRVPGSVSSINKLRLGFNAGTQNVDLDSDEWKDINVVAGALKQFLRELPEAVMTSVLYDQLIAASALQDYDERLLTMKDLIRALPAPNYLLLKRIVEHLERITDYEEINHMYATNLAIVFGPTLLRPGGTSAHSFATSMKNLGHQQNIVRNMILQYHWLFDVEDEEGGEDAEEEEGLGEFPEILEDSDEDEYEGEENEDAGDSTVRGSLVDPEDDQILVLTASQPLVSPGVDIKEAGRDKEKAMKNQRRKTIVFG